MKPTKSKLLPLASVARWWSNEKSNTFYFKNRGEWFIIRSSKPAEKPTKKPTNFFKKSAKAKEDYDNYSILFMLAVILGVSLGLNLIGFLLLM